VGTETGEHKVFQEKVHHHQLPPMEQICQFCQSVKRKDATANSFYRSGNVVLASSHDSPHEFKQLHEDPLSLIKVRSHNRNFTFTPMLVLLAENVRVDEQLAKSGEGGKRSVFKEQYIIVLVYCHLINQELWALSVVRFR
jgi:hypothetical protein